MNNKIPCIKCNEEMFTYIKSFLIKWEYTFETITLFADFPYLVINANGTLGKCTNLPLKALYRYDRELIEDIEEFLSRAAELMGHKYIKTDNIHGIEIKPGMIIETKTPSIKSFDKWYTWVVFPIKNNLAVISINAGTWYHLDKFIEDYNDEISIIRDISEDDILESGKILWEKLKRITISKTEIADKFGIDVNLIDIVE